MSDPAVTAWLNDLQEGRQSAATKLWAHFAGPMIQAARARIHPDTRSAYDEEDAAQSAFFSLCKGIAAGRFPDLNDRGGLWRLLLTITIRKVTRRHRYDRQERRDVTRRTDGSSPDHLDQLPPNRDDGELAREFAETCEEMFARLTEPGLVRIGWMKVEGLDDLEIARQLGCSQRTVRRKVERIRRRWEEDSPEATN